MSIIDPPDDHNEYDEGECPVCGGEGFVFDCFDGCCLDADYGCDDCTRPCGCQKQQASPELQAVLSEALSATKKGEVR